ncbi:MAG: rRNA maturation RNase YbeY [Chloroflexota bacterium]|nr:rRNA maturation RNase YbeY [Chloroflexota bacterium]
MDVSLLITTDERVHELNREYRQIDQPTDVLSFSQQEGGLAFVQPPTPVANLGDIVISIETANRQAAEEGRSLQDEMVHLAVHGTLHLLGYDHQTDQEEAEMNRLEQEAHPT